LSYLPEGIDLADWHDYAEKKPEEFTDRARQSMAKQVEAMVGFQDRGAQVFDYGNSIRAKPNSAGTSGRFLFPVSCRSISDRSFVKATDRFGGRRCRVTRRTSPEPIRRSSISPGE